MLIERGSLNTFDRWISAHGPDKPLETSLPAIVHIVDDDSPFRTSTGRLLRACGYAVETYESAEQLLNCLPDDPEPGCILLDVKIPGVSGPELQDRLNGRGSSSAHYFPDGASGHSHDSPGHQGRRRRPLDQAGR